MSEQLILKIGLRDDATFESFVAGPNALLKEHLQTIAYSGIATKPEEEQFIYLWGAKGVGCSHLLQATVHAAMEQGCTAVYLPLDEIIGYSPALIEGMESLDIICIDAVQRLSGNSIWEQAIFSLYNTIRENKKTVLIVAGDRPPPQISKMLPDLRSRLSWGVVYQCQALSDEEKQAAIVHRAHLRGMELSNTVAAYILRHEQRDMANIFSILDKVDEASMVEQRRLTVPFVKSVLENKD